MFNAPFLRRVSACIVASVPLMLIAPPALGQTINVSLNVYYDIPSDVNSGGQWELVAKSSHFGISVLQVKLTNVNTGSVQQGPRGNVNGTDPAGFSDFDHFPDNTILMLQQPNFPTGMQEEGEFYGVGTIANGDPGDIGPTLNSLTNGADIPWAIGDGIVVGPSIWDVAALFATGTFNDNVTPGFATTGHTGSVFTTLGSSSMFGNSAFATITREVRTNFNAAAQLPDYDDDGEVDAADYVVWRKGHPLADGNGDTFVNQLDYDLWVESFGETVPGAGGGAGNFAVAAPEPAAGFLLVFGLGTVIFVRRKRP